MAGASIPTTGARPSACRANVTATRHGVREHPSVPGAGERPLMPLSDGPWGGSPGGGPPLIAVTTSEMRVAAMHANTPEADPPRTEMALGMKYLEAIERAGGLPLVVPPLGDAAMAALLDRVDGVCLSGGPDVDPVAYGADPHPQLGPTERRLDEFELGLARAADERGLPILAICRGAQVINVARGGTLHQHLPDVVGDAVQHRQPEPSGEATHPIRISPHTTLASLVGSHWLRVNSFHHQAVREVGRGLAVTATAPDGTIEAFEARDRDFLVGVQWHAECLVDRHAHAALFSGLVGACATRRGEDAAAGGARTGRTVAGHG
jgi:putative glutamine amidotransferase